MRHIINDHISRNQPKTIGKTESSKNWMPASPSLVFYQWKKNFSLAFGACIENESHGANCFNSVMSV